MRKAQTGLVFWVLFTVCTILCRNILLLNKLLLNLQLLNKSHIARELCVTISFTVGKNICTSNSVFRYCIHFLHFSRAVLIANIKYEDHKQPNYTLPHHCTLRWEEISFNYCFNRISLFQNNSSPHRWRQCSCFPHLPFIKMVIWNPLRVNFGMFVRILVLKILTVRYAVCSSPILYCL